MIIINFFRFASPNSRRPLWNNLRVSCEHSRFICVAEIKQIDFKGTRCYSPRNSGYYKPGCYFDASFTVHGTCRANAKRTAGLMRVDLSGLQLHTWLSVYAVYALALVEPHDDRSPGGRPTMWPSLSHRARGAEILNPRCEQCERIRFARSVKRTSITESPYAYIGSPYPRDIYAYKNVGKIYHAYM